MQRRFVWPAIFTILSLYQVLSADAVLSNPSPLANGRQESILTVSSFGRYSITVTSKQGAALQLIDRMAGPGMVQGRTGEQDGRLDVLLDRGQYKILSYGPDHASGNVQLQAHPSQERNAPKPPLLPELKLVQDTLDDFQQLSYWIQVTEARTISFEAAGRNLADLRLWQDGSWLVDASPLAGIIQPRVGQPMLYCRLFAKLSPGLYLLTAYGGPAQPWAQDSPDHPFTLRSGIPRLADAGRQRVTASPFGIDRFLVPGSATYFRLELPEAKPASIEAGWFDPNQPFSAPQARGDISKKSLLPVAEIEGFGDPAKETLVTITVEPGQPYILQQFEKRNIYHFKKDGKYWISTVHSGHAADSVDATALLTRTDWHGITDPTPYRSETILIDSSHGWARKFNLLDTLTLFFEVNETGKYEIVADGTDAEFRFEPFLISIPEHYSAPKFRGPGSVWSLDAGSYILTAVPKKKGILTLGVRPTGLMDFMTQMVGMKSQPEKAPVRASVHFPEVDLDLDHSYTLYINEQPEVKAGTILRKLPLDLSQALFVSLQPDESVSVPSTMSEAGTVRAVSEDGSLLEVKSNDGPWRKTLPVTQGPQTIEVRNSGTATVQASVLFESVTLQAPTPLPSLPDAALAALPIFDQITEGSSVFFDLERHGSRTLLLHVDHFGLYVVESTGLLATQGNLRTRTNPSFVREGQNGTGRNFLIQQYLREGDYQVTVLAMGESQGHLGVHLSKTQILEGGFLSNQLPARISVRPGDAVLYRFKVKQKEEYRFRSFGLQRTFRCRLEDEDGWPIEQPNIPAQLTRWFEPGSYRLMLMPENVETRRLTLLEELLEPEKHEGHGPFALQLSQKVEHLWQEPAQGQERRPDVWLITVPAPIDANISLSEEMQGELLQSKEDGTLTRVATVAARKGWKGRLDTGSYRLAAVNVRRNNQVYYTISIMPEQLVAGTERSVSVPGSVSVSVGADQLIELSSFGSTDARAKLSDGKGLIVATNDDRPDDWNFHLSRTLRPGFYTLEVEPVGKRYGEVTVAMSAPQEILQEALLLPARKQVSPGASVNLYPLDVAPGAGLLLLSARSTETIGIALESEESGIRRWIGGSVGHRTRLEIPLPSSAAIHYRLRVWSVDHRNTPLTLTAAAASMEAVPEQQLLAGSMLQKVAGVEPPVAAAAIRLDRPGVFRVEGNAETVRWTTDKEVPAKAVENSLLAADTTLLWIVKDLSKTESQAVVRASRAVLAPGEDQELVLTLDPGRRVAVDLAPSEPGSVIAFVSSPSGQPAISLLNAANVQEGQFHCSPRNLAIGTHSSAAVLLRSDSPVAIVWASGETEPIRARVRQLTLPPSFPEQISWGLLNDTIKGKIIRVLQLPSGNKRVRLTLGAHTIAALADGGSIESVHWNGDEPFAEIIETTAGTLTLFHTDEQEDSLQIETLPLEITQWTAPLSTEAPYEKHHPESGILRLPLLRLPQNKPATLHIRGAASEGLLIAPDGQILRGQDISVPQEGGELSIRHGPGLLLAWVEMQGDPRSFWGTGNSKISKTVVLPAGIPLDGNLQSFRISTNGPTLLQVRTVCPAVLRVTPEGGESQVEAFEKGALLSAYLPQGKADITIRGLAGGTLSGSADLTGAIVTNTAEGLGAKTLLPPGGTQIYFFQVKRAGRVGVGVWSDSGAVEGTVLDAGGHRIGSGVVQMPELIPGTYLLSLHAPENGQPVEARPALVGLETPPTGPADQVIRGYIEAAKNYKPQDSIAFAAPATRAYDTTEPNANRYSYYDRYNDANESEEAYSDDE